jgi:hypothetical protein
MFTLIHGCPHISLVFREMWDATALTHKLQFHNEHLRSRVVVSHISRKTSEMWGTREFVGGTGF